MTGYKIIGIILFFILTPAAWYHAVQAILGMRASINFQQHIKDTHGVFGYPLYKLHTAVTNIQLHDLLEKAKKQDGKNEKI